MAVPLVLVAYEDLDRSVYPWACLARALGRAGREPLYVGELRRPTPLEVARITANGGAWAPLPEPARDDGVSVVRPLDLPAQRFELAARWDRRSLETAITRHGDHGWIVLFSSASGKPWPRPEGWRRCWFPIDEFAAEDARFAERETGILWPT